MSSAQKRLPQVDSRGAAVQFLEEHETLLHELADMKEQNVSLRTANASLLAEVKMLREELGRTDRARIRLQGFCASLTARLDVIQETVAVAMKEAVAHQVEPALAPAAAPAPQSLLEMTEAHYRPIVTLTGSVAATGLPPNNY